MSFLSVFAHNSCLSNSILAGEEITALAAIPGGFVAGVAHTAAAQLDGTALRAPADPMSGAAILIRPVR